jgi:hypothetical protein
MKLQPVEWKGNTDLQDLGSLGRSETPFPALPATAQPSEQHPAIPRLTISEQTPQLVLAWCIISISLSFLSADLEELEVAHEPPVLVVARRADGGGPWADGRGGEGRPRDRRLLTRELEATVLAVLRTQRRE